jgi:hypothetical protein
MWRRFEQWQAAIVPPSGADAALAARWLSPTLMHLFLSQHPRDVVHASATATWLLERDFTDADLITAALLHDVAKGDQRRVDRAAHVVLSPTHLERFVASTTSTSRLRSALARSMTHAARSAELIIAAGGSERAAALTRDHHRPPGDDPVLALLQRADARN